jgi:hypothetical protein
VVVEDVTQASPAPAAAGNPFDLGIKVDSPQVQTHYQTNKHGYKHTIKRTNTDRDRERENEVRNKY